MPWEKIDTGQMLVTVRELAQQVRSAQKGLRAWPLYAWLQDEAGGGEAREERILEDSGRFSRDDGSWERRREAETWFCAR